MASESSNFGSRTAWYHSRPSHGAPRRPRVHVEPERQAPERGAVRLALSEGHPPIAGVGRDPHQPGLSSLLLQLRPGAAPPGDATAPQAAGLLHLVTRRAAQAHG